MVNYLRCRTTEGNSDNNIVRLLRGLIVFNQILCGNHLEILPRFPDDTFDMWLTSPPYDNLRDYEGYDFKFEPLAHELYRTLKPGGVGVWIVNDETKDCCESLNSFHQAIYFVENVGFKLNDTMIYAQKGCRFPVGYGHKKYGGAFEFMFVLTKGKAKTFNPLSDIKVKNIHKLVGGTKRQPNGKLTKLHGIGKKYNKQRTRDNVWFYASGYMVSSKDINSFEHPASFPEKLAEDHILSWSNPGDAILDPMCGSGTTCKMAAKHGRTYVGIDIAETYCEIARKRVALIEAQPMLFNC